MRIYVASSWRNEFQPAVVRALRADGFEVYDFKDEEGFSWREVDPDWQRWPEDIPKYLAGIGHPAAQRGFNRDMTALRQANLCVMVMPCGMSASLEVGWAIGAGRPTAVYIPAMREPDLMVKMAELITNDFESIRLWAASKKPDTNRCAVCGWPLQTSPLLGCVRGNCSQRPLPGWFYDPERALRERAALGRADA